MSIPGADVDDNPDCKLTSPSQIKRAGILEDFGGEHIFKKEMGYTPEGHFDICACRDGTIRMAEVDGCGWNTPKGETGYRWR